MSYVQDQSLRVRVIEVIADRTGVHREQLGEDIFFGELGCDSLDVVEVGIAIDEEFGVDFQAKATGKHLPKNLSEVMKILEICLAEKAAA